MAAEPVIGSAEVAALLDGRGVQVRIAPVRGAVWLAWRLHLVVADPGWPDIAVPVPPMSTDQIRTDLG